MKKLITKEINLVSGSVKDRTYNYRICKPSIGVGVSVSTQTGWEPNLNSIGTQTYSPQWHGMSRKNMLILGLNIITFATSLAFLPKSKAIPVAAPKEQPEETTIYDW